MSEAKPNYLELAYCGNYVGRTGYSFELWEYAGKLYSVNRKLGLHIFEVPDSLARLFFAA